MPSGVVWRESMHLFNIKGEDILSYVILSVIGNRVGRCV